MVRSLSSPRARESIAETLVQVLFKRKPVQFLPQPAIEDDSSEVSLLLQGGVSKC